MPNTSEISEAKRALREKYLRGELPRIATAVGTTPQHPQESPVTILSTDSRVSLIPVQTGGSKRPFFYFHVHWIGGAFYSFTVAHDLGSDQPFYIMDPYKFDGLQVPPTIEAMAAAYIRSIRAVQSEGPYLLGGNCGGGLIAYEIAQQLHAEGQPVDLLVLINPTMAVPIQLVKLVGGLIRRIGNLIRLSPDKQLDWFLQLRYIERALRHARDENMEHIMQRWRSEHPKHFSLVPSVEALRQEWMGIFIWMISGYTPRQYPGRVTYFLARENPASRKVWWGEVAEGKNVEIQIIPGTHDTWRTKYIHDFAKQLQICLSKVQPADTSTQL